MKELIVLAVGMGMVSKMEQANTFERVEAAETVEAKTAIVQETEKFVFEVANDIFKSEEEIGADGVEAKNGFIKELIVHQYNYFNLESPFDNGTTFEDVKARNGYGVAELGEDDEFFA